MEDLDIVAILGTGVSGFSFLLLLMGYKLTSDVQNKILNIKMSDIDSKHLKTWERITDKQVTNTRVFMGFSFVFLVSGLLMMAYRPDTKVIISVTPMDTAFPPIVYVQEKMVTIDENGRGSFIVKDEQAVSIDHKVIFEELTALKLNYAIASASEKALIEDGVKNSTDSGYGDVFK